jgi:hypothetical protein
MQISPSGKRRLYRAAAAALAAPLIVIPIAVLAVSSGVTVPVKLEGTVGNGTDSVAFSGQATITPRIITDTVFNGPTVLELVIDFASVKGTEKSSGRQFGTVAQAIVRRPLLAFDQVEVTFPYYAGAEVSATRTALASFGVSFAAASGVTITSKVTSLPF